MMKLEVIAFNISCCDKIERAGAHRIELCANPQEGGTTPSAGFIDAARKKVSIELFPIIRPRGGDFLYSEDEYEVIKADVIYCRDAGCDGIVTGMLNSDGLIDKEKISHIVKLAHPMEVTFHRAFDRTPDAFAALEDVIDAGCTRILTSGLQATAIEGSDLLLKLVEQAKGRIIIMPGSGIRSSNITDIARLTGALEFHSSARKLSADNMQYHNVNLSDGKGHAVVDSGEVIKMMEALQLITNGKE